MWSRGPEGLLASPALRGRSRVVRLIAAVAMSLLFLPVHDGQAANPGANGMLRWDTPEREGEGYGDVSRRIFEMNPDGSDGVAITSVDRLASLDSQAQFSADGNRVVFLRCEAVLFGCARSRDLYIVNADGSGERRLTTGTGASWSPDGTQLVLIDSYTWPDGFVTDALYVYNTTAAAGTCSSAHPAAGSLRPSGRRWATRSSTTTIAWDHPGRGFRAAGGWCSRTGAARLCSGKRATRANAPTRAAMTGRRSDQGDLHMRDLRQLRERIELKVLTIASHSLVNITNTPEPASDATGATRETNPSWSPDGQRIVYQRRRHLDRDSRRAPTDQHHQ